MDYRKLPHGEEMINPVGIGMGTMQVATEEEIENIVKKAIDHGINFFDLCGGHNKVYAPFGRAIANQREKVYFQMHFGAVYNEEGEYGWSQDLDAIKKTFEWEMQTLGVDYIDFGFLHCLDEVKDFEAMVQNGVLDYVKALKQEGKVRHIGFSSHTPEVAHKILDTGLIDMMMFSLNPAYDFECGDKYAIGTVKERYDLFARCQKLGVGISVMKPFHGGKLLSADQSPFGESLTHYQCMAYCLDRPGVMAVVPGVQSMEQLDTLIGYMSTTDEEKDYSVIGTFTAEKISGTCVYCNHCLPCPAGIPIGLVNKYYDLAVNGDVLAEDHYKKLKVDATACLHCGHCESRCPFGVPQESRMDEIAAYFEK